MVWGNPADERITCVHEELFIRGWDRRKPTVAQTADLLPVVRKWILEGRNDAADSLITTAADNQLRAMGARQRWPVIPHPAFDLRIRYLNGRPSGASYQRKLNLAEGTVTVAPTAAGGREEVFTSRADNVTVIRLTAAKGSKLNVSLALEETPGREGVYMEHNLDSAFRYVQAGAQPGWLTYGAGYRYDAGGYDGLARVERRGGRMACSGKSLEVTDADEVLILLRVIPRAGAPDPTALAAERQALLNLPADYQTLLSPHRKEHGAMFRRMQLDLGCAGDWARTPIERMLDTISHKGVTPLFIEQINAMGRYLLISSCGKYPPPLQGIWGGGWKPAWNGGFVWDSNINLAISAASMSNLPECAESYCRYVEHLLPGWRLNACNYLGCRGFLVAHYNDPENGYLTHFGRSFPWMCWPGGAGWNIRPFYEYAMLTGDERMLRERVYPLYREMACFYADFLVKGADSLYHIVPSVSPENAVRGTQTWLSSDATMDVAVAREVFSLLLQMGERFGMPRAEADRWRAYLTRLPDYRINADGALAEWVAPRYPDVYNHRHLSHLYPVFPGGQIGKNRGEPRLRQAARVALEKRFAFDSAPAHGLIHVALQAARLGELGMIRTNLDRFCRRHYLYNSLITSHDPNHTVYNLDAVLSLPRLFMEMLVYTEPGYVELLPAWPAEYPEGKLSGVRLYGGHTLTLSWRQGRLVSARLQAHRNDTLRIAYDGQTREMRLVKDKTYTLKF